jgi:hypothetical protein
MSEETRSVGQIVWKRKNGLKPLKIEQLFKRYVTCSDGHSYNLKSGETTGKQRGYEGGTWDISPIITIEDCSADFKVQQERNKQCRIHREVSEAIKNNAHLPIEALEQIQSILDGFNRIAGKSRPPMRRGSS